MGAWGGNLRSRCMVGLLAVLMTIAKIAESSDTQAREVTLLVLSGDLVGFPLGTASSGLKLRAIFSEPVSSLNLDNIIAANGALDKFTLKTFDNSTSSLSLLSNGATVSQLTSTRVDPDADPSAWRGLLGSVALDFYVRPQYPLSTVSVTFQPGTISDVSGNANTQSASVAFFSDPTNPMSSPGYPFLRSIAQTSVTLAFSFTKTCTVTFTLVNQPVGFAPGNWSALQNPSEESDPLQKGATFNGSIFVLAGKVGEVTVGGLTPNQGYLLMVSATDQYGNQAQAVPGAALQTRDVGRNAVANPSLAPAPLGFEAVQVVLSHPSARVATMRYTVTPFNPNSLVPTQTALPSCDTSDALLKDASSNTTLQFDHSVIVSAISCGNGTSSEVVVQPLATQADAPSLTLPAGPFVDSVTVGLLYNGSLQNATIKYTFTPAGSPLIAPSCPYTGWAGYGRKAGPQAQITLVTSGTLQAVTCSNAGLQSDVVSTGPICIAASAPRDIQPDASLLSPYTLSLSTSTPGGSVRYIYNPLSGPLLTSPLTCLTPGALPVNATSDVVLWESGVLTAITCKDGLIASDVTTKTFQLQASPPKFSPTKGIGSVNVTIATRTSGALLLYTSDPKVPLNCPAPVALSGGSTAQPGVSGLSAASTDSGPSATVLSARTRVTFLVNDTGTWRATACPSGNVSLSPNNETAAKVVVAQPDPSNLPAGQAQVTAEVTILDANPSIFNDSRAQQRFETAVAAAISASGNVTVSSNDVLVTSIVLAGRPAGRSTLELPRQRRLLASSLNISAANATSLLATSSPSSPSLSVSLNESLPSVNVPPSPPIANPSDQNSNSTSLVVGLTVVTVPQLAPAVRSALTTSVETGTLAGFLTAAGFKVGGSFRPANSPPGSVGSSSSVPSSAFAPGLANNVTNSSVVAVSITAAQGVALTAASVQYAQADAQNCIFTAQTGECARSPINRRQCARTVNYTLVTSPGPAGQSCPVGLSPFLTRVQAFEACPTDQCPASDESGGSSLPVGVWVVIALLIVVLLIALAGGIRIFRRRNRKARAQGATKDPENTWQASLRDPPPASQFQSGGDVGLRAAPMWDSAALERGGHSDVAAARAHPGGANEGNIVDFEAYCDAWDRRFINSSGGRTGPIHTTSEAGDSVTSDIVHTDATSEPIHADATFQDKPVDNAQLAGGATSVAAVHTGLRAPLHTDAEPRRKKHKGRALAIAYGKEPSALLERSNSGPLSSDQKRMHDAFADLSKSGPLFGVSAFFAKRGDNPKANKRLAKESGESVRHAGRAAAAARAVQNLSDVSMEEVVLEMMKIDQESVARKDFAGTDCPGSHRVWDSETVTETVTSAKGGATLSAFENRPLTEPQQEDVNSITSQIHVALKTRDVSPSMMRIGEVPFPLRNPSPGKRNLNPGLPPRGSAVTGANAQRSASPGLQGAGDGGVKLVQRNTARPYSAERDRNAAGVHKRAKTPDLLPRYSPSFLTQRASPSAPVKARPESGDHTGTTSAAPGPVLEPRRSRSCERPRERSDSDEQLDVKLKSIIVELREGSECPEPVVVNFGEKDEDACAVAAAAAPHECTDRGNVTLGAVVDSNGPVKRSESLTKLGKRIGAWMMSAEPRPAAAAAATVPVAEIHVIRRAADNSTDPDDDRSSIMGDMERSAVSSVVPEVQGSKIWAWIRTAAQPEASGQGADVGATWMHSDARSVVSEADAAEMRAHDLESGEVRSRDSSGDASFWKKRIFGRSLSTASFNSPPKNEPLEGQKQVLLPSWAAVSY